MKIFIDTAELNQIKEAISWGIVDGVTTNPSLIKKAVDSMKSKGEKINIEDYIERILITAKPNPVSLEVIGLTEAEMYTQGHFLYERFNPIAKNVVVKIPITPSIDSGNTKYDGLKTIGRLAERKIPVNCTLIFTPEQALLAAKAGAKYVSPFAGRIDDELRKIVGETPDKNAYYPAEGKRDYYNNNNMFDDNGIVSGVDLVAKTVQILKNYNLKTEVIAASIRNPRQARECMLAGSHIATIPFGVLEKMVYHGKTEEGIKDFTRDIVPEYKALFD